MKLIPYLRSLPRAKLTAIAIGIVGLIAVIVISARSSSPKQVYSYYKVNRSDFLISVVEGGTIEAVNEVVVRSEVEGTARIIFIVPEGSTVKKGDLLVELDSSATQDAANLQQINVEKAQFAMLQAEQQLEIEKSTVDSEVQAAKLKEEFAASDFKKYAEGEALQLARNAQIEITNVMETLQISQERLEWTEELYKKGFETKGNLDKDRLAVSQGRLKLEQSQKALWMLENFDAPKRKRELEAARQETQENLERVKLQGDRKLAQFKADVTTQKSTLELNKAKLQRDMKQLKATKIFAPQDGLVVYASGSGRFSNESMIEEGAVIRNRQEIIKLPDVSSMKLQVKIHESHINQIHRGQQAFVVLDSMPDQRFQGTVNRVAPLPDGQSRWGNPNLKVYATEVLITEKLPDVKPGVSARAEVVVTNLPNVISVPIQAVTTRKGKPAVFVEGKPPKPVMVTVGMYNSKFIEIASGLKEGDRVLLSPPFDNEEKDLAGAVIAPGEVPPAADTNTVNRVLNQRSEATEEMPRGSRRPGGGEARGPSGPAGEDGPRPGVAAEGAPGEGRRSRPRGDGTESPSGATGGAGGVNREEMVKRFDKNGDGQIDETERAAMREQFGRRRSEGQTNQPPQGARPANPVTRE